MKIKPSKLHSEFNPCFHVENWFILISALNCCKINHSQSSYSVLS